MLNQKQNNSHGIRLAKFNAIQQSRPRLGGSLYALQKASGSHRGSNSNGFVSPSEASYNNGGGATSPKLNAMLATGSFSRTR